MYRIIVGDQRTEVRDDRGDTVFATANRVFWEPPGRVVAIGNPDEWIVQPGPMSSNVIEAHIVEEAVGASPKLRDLWEAFLVYCEVAAIKRSKPTGLWGRLKRYIVTNTVVLRFSDPRARSFVARAILESRVRRWNLVYE